MGDAQRCRRVRIVKQRVQRVGRQCGGVVFIKLDQRFNQLVGGRLPGSVAVGFEFVPARQTVQQRCQQESEHWGDEEEQNQRQRRTVRFDTGW